MREFVAQVRHGNPQAVRKFIMTTRKSPDRASAIEALGLSPSVFYRLLRELHEKGHTV